MFFSLSLLGVAIICSLLILMHMLIFAQSSLYVAKVISPPFPMSQSDPKLIPNPATLTRKSSVLMHAHTHGVFLFHLPALAPPIIQTHTLSGLSLCVPVHSISLYVFVICTHISISNTCYANIFTVWWHFCKFIRWWNFSFCSHKVEFGCVLSLWKRLSGNVIQILLRSIECQQI